MTTTREQLTAALNGETPERTPLSLYHWMVPASGVGVDGWGRPRPLAVDGLSATDPKGDVWRNLFERGLGICQHCYPIKHVEHGVKDGMDTRVEGDRVYHIYTKETPVGTLQRVTANDWHYEDWIKKPQDYKIRQWIVEHTELVTRYEEVEEAEELVGDYGVTVITGSRTPAMSINIDWAGTQQCCLDVALEVPELFELYEAQRKLFLEEARLIAAGPGRFVKWFENLTISMLGPKRYADLLVSVYDETIPILEASGKRVMVHYDGELRVIADHIAAAPFHIIESLTEPPEGDMTYDECRAAWPYKTFWGNINLAHYYRPPDALREAVVAMRQRAGKRAFAFEISEDLPDNWETSIPIVLETLEDLD
jgi:hypothetical protein